jgi:hypothetical protein
MLTAVAVARSTPDTIQGILLASRVFCSTAG